MEQIKQIIAEINRLKAEIPYHENAWSVLNKLEVFINSLPAAEEHPSRELEKVATTLNLNEVANQYAYAHDTIGINKDTFERENTQIHKMVRIPIANEIVTAVKFGANWQKEQMLKSAIDAKIINDEMMVECEQGSLILEPLTYSIGQKLKILIIEEDEQ